MCLVSLVGVAGGERCRGQMMERAQASPLSETGAVGEWEQAEN